MQHSTFFSVIFIIMTVCYLIILAFKSEEKAIVKETPGNQIPPDEELVQSGQMIQNDSEANFEELQKHPILTHELALHKLPFNPCYGVTRGQTRHVDRKLKDEHVVMRLPVDNPVRLVNKVKENEQDLFYFEEKKLCLHEGVTLEETKDYFVK